MRSVRVTWGDHVDWWVEVAFQGIKHKKWETHGKTKGKKPPKSSQVLLKPWELLRRRKRHPTALSATPRARLSLCPAAHGSPMGDQMVNHH